MSLVNGKWSLDQLVTRIDNDLLLIPAFQRSFVWTLENERDLFDSLIRGIPTGSITLATPTFPIAVANVDTRAGSDRGTTQDFVYWDIAKFEGHTETKRNELGREYKSLLVLDGQQRITSIYRVLKNYDTLYMAFNALTNEIKNFDQMTSAKCEILSVEHDEAMCVNIADAYSSRDTPDSDLLKKFHNSSYFQYLKQLNDPAKIETEERRYQRLIKAVGEVLRHEQCINFIESAASEEDLLPFFERSNTKGAPLSFQDLLNARTFRAFHEATSQSFSEALKKLDALPPKFHLRNMEDNFIRIRCYEPLLPKVSKGENPLSKTVILKKIDGDEIVKNFFKYINNWAKPIDFLYDTKLATPRDEMPFPLMVIPTFFFLKALDFNRQNVSKPQLDFFQWWYWASVFSRRYSFQTNEAAYTDINRLEKVARLDVEDLSSSIITEYKPNLSTPEDVMNLRGKSGHFQRAIATLSIFFNDAKCIFSGQALATLPAGGRAKGTKTAKKIVKFDYHHIFPVAYLASRDYRGGHRDSVANLMYATQKQRGGLSTAPSDYLPNKTTNPAGITTHFVTEQMYVDLLDKKYDSAFDDFVAARSSLIAGAINQVAGEETGKKVLAALKNASKKSRG